MGSFPESFSETAANVEKASGAIYAKAQSGECGISAAFELDL
jgi:hypothetical protein